MNVMRETVSGNEANTALPLFVDLDGTLIAGDIAEEAMARAFRRRGAVGAALAGYRGNGLSGMKRALSEHVPPDVAHLPYREEVLDYIRRARAAGRRVVLATAADEPVARAVADHLGLFDDVLASTPGRNLKGEAKRDAIVSAAPDGYEYLGDSAADIPVWQSASRAGFVAPSAAAARQMRAKPQTVSLRIDRRGRRDMAILRAMRPHQWAKNVLVFVPVLFAHLYTQPGALVSAVLAFLCFSLCASGVYLLNDMVDVEADRRHASKRFRPFAAGQLTIRQGLVVSAALFAAAFIGAFALVGPAFGLVLFGYGVLTTAYTFCFKRYSTVDVVALSLLYTVRILAGSAAVAVAPSPWLLSYSLFFFLSLAYMKRYIELAPLAEKTEDGKLPSRNYYASDVQLVQTFGIANGALSVLTLAQYVNSAKVHAIYNAPILLWLIVPVMMFWTYRSWTWASRGRIGDDPVVFALRDRISRLCVFLIIGVIVLARYIDGPWLPA